MKAPSRMKAVLALALVLATMVSPNFSANRAAADVSAIRGSAQEEAALDQSGVYTFNAVGNLITECPQAGLPNNRRDQSGQDSSYTGQPRPLDQRQIDTVEQISQQSRNVRVNQDYSCFPQNETSLSINPCSGSAGNTGMNSLCTTRNNVNDGRNTRCANRTGDGGSGAAFDCNLNVVGGANDYRTGMGQSGFYASTDGGRHFYDGILPGPTTPRGAFNSGGDPALVHDRAGIVYYAFIALSSADTSNGVYVSRSTNGGFTWTRPCTPIQPPTPNPSKPDASRCGSRGDPRQPGDGSVIFSPDPGTGANFNDKEYIAAGPRPAGVTPVCFTPVTRTPGACKSSVVGVDRLYVTWTNFVADNTSSMIMLSYSDDQARSWSPPRPISGSAPFCTGSRLAADACSDDQGSSPTVSPATGYLYVAFENFDTPNENQYLVVRSHDGGQTFEGPFFVTPIFDVNYPQSGPPFGTRSDCKARGQQDGRKVLTNSCFRVNSTGTMVVDRRGGAFANNLYLVMSDNRNGTPASTNTDVFFFKSTDGGTTWIGPTRVNDDPSNRPATVSRDCTAPRPAPAPPRATDNPNCANAFGNDQWFPWIDISDNGVLSVGFFDRRLDTSSVASEHPESRQRPGNYLTWFWGATCRVSATGPVSSTGTTVPTEASQCVAPEATVIRQPVAPVAPDAGPQAGNVQSAFPFKNVQISDVPSNMDYAFRNGLFIGDYNSVAVPHSNVVSADNHADSLRQSGRANQQGTSGVTAYGFWTDARNGRGSGNATSPDPAANQPGRNPACEQSDVFLDVFPATRQGDGGDNAATQASLAPFLVTPCPTAAIDQGNRGGQDNQGGQDSQGGQNN